MAMNFPSTPTDGEIYGNYIYSSTKGAWLAKPTLGSVAVNSSTAPTSGNEGDLWFNTNDGTLYVYYNDGTSGQWVESRAPITADGYYSPNYIINGGMDIWQRGTSIAISSPPTVYSADRWESYRDGYAAGITISRQATGLTGFQYCARVQRDAGNTSGAGFTFAQAFESITSLPIAGQTLTLSFYARVGANYAGGTSFFAGIRSGTITDGTFRAGNIGTAIATVTPTLTTSWQRFTVTGTASSSATQIGVNFYWTPSGTAGANDYVEFTGVQLEQGSVATPFRRNANSIQGELAACQRYYYRLSVSSIGGTGNPRLATGVVLNTSAAEYAIRLPVPMRITPTSFDSSSANTFASYNGTSNVLRGTGIASAPSDSSNETGHLQLTITGGSMTQSQAIQLLNYNGTSCYLGWSAEL